MGRVELHKNVVVAMAEIVKRVLARAAMPCLKSSGNEARDDSATPSALNPLYEKPMYSVDGGMSVHGAAVVT